MTHAASLPAVVWLVPAIPLAGAVINLLIGKRLGKEGVRLMALSAMGGSFLGSLLAFAMLVSAGRTPEGHGNEGVLQFKWNAWHWLDVSTGGGFGTAPIDVDSNIRKSVPAPTKCNRVFSTQVRSSPGQPCRFGDLLSDV